ncbi:unnamed protein product, partial [Pleuronectes platessa]
WIYDFLTGRPQVVRIGSHIPLPRIPCSPATAHPSIKIKEMIVDYRRHQGGGHPRIHIGDAEIEMASTFRFLVHHRELADRLHHSYLWKHSGKSLHRVAEAAQHITGNSLRAIQEKLTTSGLCRRHTTSSRNTTIQNANCFLCTIWQKARLSVIGPEQIKRLE